MLKEYRDDFLGEKAFEKLNKDIDANPGVGFEIVGYTQTAFIKWNAYTANSHTSKMG